MKLLCVSPSYWPAFRFGGPIFSLHNLNKRLAEKGIDITVYTTVAGQGGGISADQEINLDKVKVTFFKYARLFDFLGSTGWHFSTPMTEALRQNLNLFDAVYILSVWNYPVTASAHYCRRAGKPYIVSPRGQLYQNVLKRKFWKKWIYYNLIIKKYLNCASAIHYTSEEEKNGCHTKLGLRSRPVVIPNGIDLGEFNNCASQGELRQRYPLLQDKKVILFLSRINWKKGLDILIKAYSILAKEREDLHLLIVGNDEGGYLKKVKRWIRDYNLDKEVTFTGMLTGRDKLKAYAAGDIFVLPSYSENFGLAAVEAMAYGLPVVISNQVGIHRKIASARAGIVVEPDIAQLSRAIKDLLDNPDSGRKMAENAKLLVREEFELDAVADKMIGMFEDIISNNSF